MSGQKASYGNGPFEPDYYAILGVARDAPVEEIKARYKALVLKFHPDREGSALAAEAMVSINLAYEVLSDPWRRKAYDAGPEVVPWTVSQEEGPAPAKNPRPAARLSQNMPVLVAAAVAAACLAGLLAGPAGPAGRTVAGEYLSGNHDLVADILHGGLVALPLIIPGFGVAWGILAVFTAGVADRAVLMTSPGIAGTLLPYAVIATALKIAACYAGMSRSINLAQASRRRRFGRLERSHTVGDILLVLVLYGLAALAEYAMAGWV